MVGSLRDDGRGFWPGHLGFVWRAASPADHICVLPKTRDQTAAENAEAGARRQPGGGASGPATCRQGFVRREAFAGDQACVPPASRLGEQPESLPLTTGVG